jgi:putative glycosyltransferase (TIGR04372 family)
MLPKTLEFTTEEYEHSDIENLRLQPNQKFICLHVRDSAFASQFFNNSSHQTFRNCEIETFLNASEVLANRGYVVFRTGVKVNKNLVSDNPRVVDYATNGMRSEFLDIYLGAKASFVISTASGWDSVPTIFRRPTLKVNVLPVCAYDNLSFPHLIVPKVLCDIASKEPSSLFQILDRGVERLYDTDGYTNAGLEIRDLSPEELVEAVTEMAQRVEGTFVETPEQKEMQAKLKHILSTHPKLQPSPNYYPIRAQFASCFLSRYPNFLDGLD